MSPPKAAGVLILAIAVSFTLGRWSVDDSQKSDQNGNRGSLRVAGDLLSNDIVDRKPGRSVSSSNQPEARTAQNPLLSPAALEQISFSAVDDNFELTAAFEELYGLSSDASDKVNQEIKVYMQRIRDFERENMTVVSQSEGEFVVEIPASQEAGETLYEELISGAKNYLGDPALNALFFGLLEPPLQRHQRFTVKTGGEAGTENTKLLIRREEFTLVKGREFGAVRSQQEYDGVPEHYKHLFDVED